MSEESLRCAGCDEEKFAEEFLHIDVHGSQKKPIVLCRSRRHKYPRPECMKKYWEKGLPCVGCDNPIEFYYGYKPGGDRHLRPICGDCDAILREAQARGAKGKESWYSVSTYEAFSGLPDREGIARHFGAMLGFKGKCFLADAVPLLERPADNTGDLWLLLPKWQAVAAKKFLEALIEQVAKLRIASKQEGHSMLVRLARGETSVVDYEEDLNRLRKGDDDGT